MLSRKDYGSIFYNIYIRIGLFLILENIWFLHYNTKIELSVLNDKIGGQYGQN